MISAVIPARNAEATLARALASVRAQTHPEVECIVVDDGSTDGTAELAERLGARVIGQGHAGVAAARNRGAREARGELLAFLDADDEWLPERLERMAAALAGADACICANSVVGDDPPMGRVVRMRPWPVTVEQLLAWEGTVVSPGSNLLIRREAFPGFDESLPIADDWPLLVELVAAGRLTYVDEPLVVYHWHGSNLSRDLDALGDSLRRSYGRLPGGRTRSARGGRHRFLAVAHARIGDRRRALAHAARFALLDPPAALRALRR